MAWEGSAPLSTSPPLVRDRDDRVLGGVASGIAAHLAVDPAYVRAAFVALSGAGGAGVVVYLGLWAFLAEGAVLRRPAQPQRLAALVCAVLGTLLLLREAGWWFSDPVAWALGAMALGSALLWIHSGEAERARLTGLAARLPADPAGIIGSGRAAGLRLAAGGALVLLGVGIVVGSTASIAAAGSVLLAIMTTAAGLLLVGGPWLVRLGRQLAAERRARIRLDERAEVAAHLHDSVLQTLALIQRSETRAEAAALARRQERELRSWLFQGFVRRDAEGLQAALEQVADGVEADHHVPVEVVVVGGDVAVDEPLRALVAAVREAAVNAARHAAAPKVSIFAEVEAEAVGAYVTDEGQGFDPAAVPDDRRGIAESIVGRMRRAGGSARVHTGPEGTEVELRIVRGAVPPARAGAEVPAEPR